MAGDLIFRKAAKEDIIPIIEMVWDDVLRKNDRMAPSFDREIYMEQFEKISNDENQYLLVVEHPNMEIVAACQITLIHYLPFLDKRVLVEFVRVKSDLKGQGIGRKMFTWIESTARSWNANMIQLTTDARRQQAQDFYTSLGYQPSHIGMKLLLHD